MDNSHTKDESSSDGDSSSLKDSSNKFIDDNSIISDASKRKLLESESAASNPYKKARFSWQVKGSKEKNVELTTDVPIISPENISETFDSENVKPASDILQPISGASHREEERQPSVSNQAGYEDRQPFNVSNQGYEVRQPSNVSNQHLEVRQPSNVSNSHHEVRQPSNVSNSHHEVRQPSNGSNSHHEVRQPSHVSNSHHEVRQPSDLINQGYQVRQPPNLSNQQLFHAMDFDPPSALQTDNQRDMGSSTIPQEHLDILSGYLDNTRANPRSLSNPPRIKHVSTSLHACMVNAIVPVITPIANANPNLPTASVSVIAPNNTTDNSTNHGVRERVEFQDALRGMHRPNLSEYEKWEKKNAAGAIVDNVFNKTLEEMGISPDAASNRRSMDRTAVENQSILAAISSQGLTANRTERTEPTAGRSEPTAERSEPTAERSEPTAEGSEVRNDFEYLRQNRAVFNRTFERLGMRRYDVIQRHIPNRQGAQTNTVIAQNQVQTENLATQTSDDIVSSQHNENSGSCVHDKVNVESGISHLETDVSASRGYRAELNVRVENIPTSSTASESDITSCTENEQVNVDTHTDNDVNEIPRGNESKEKDVGVSENVLNLALSAAIQSQGLSLK